VSAQTGAGTVRCRTVCPLRAKAGIRRVANASGAPRGRYAQAAARVGVPCGSPIGTPALATSPWSCGARGMTRNAHDACTEWERHHEGTGFVEVIVQ